MDPQRAARRRIGTRDLRQRTGGNVIVVGTAARARGQRTEVSLQNGRMAGKTDWLAGGDDPELSPTVFLAELPAHCTLATHFHRENQFQLFVRGQCTLGRHAIRPVFDTGAVYVAQSRDRMVRGPKRQLRSEPVAPVAAEELRDLAQPQRHDLIPLQSDGIAARRLRLPPHCEHTDLDPGSSGGQFVVVIAGAIAHGDEQLGPCDMMFVSADEQAPRLVATNAGAEMVLLQLPQKADAYRGRGLANEAAANAPRGSQRTSRRADL